MARCHDNSSMETWLVTGLIVILGGCALPNGPMRSRPNDHFSSTMPAITKRVAPPGSSVRGTLLALHVFGNAPHPVLVLAAIHGDEANTVAISRGLIEDLEKDPD